MNNLYYGSGTCSLETSNVVGLEIKYKGKITIKDRTSDNYAIMSNDRKILIFPVGNVEPLSNLFEYRGEFEITSTFASDINGKRVGVNTNKIMDYSELLDTNAEDITTKSERLNSRYQFGAKSKKTKVFNNIIKNQYSKGELYLENAQEVDDSSSCRPYTGDFHVHVNEGKAMTGSEHTSESRDLYVLAYKNKRAVKKKTKKTRRTKSTTGGRSSSGGGSMGGGGGGY